MDSAGHFSDPVSMALAEDVGTGDVTCEFFVDPARRGVARIVVKESAIIAAGVEVAAEVFLLLDESLEVRIIRPSGSEIQKGDAVLEITGSVRSILTAERTALNFLQRLSGVATLTRAFVNAVKPHPTAILDTRKTTPNLRALEKAAVLSGGGTNHRFGLYDMAMIKDNHFAASAGVADIQAKIRTFREHYPDLRVEIEAQTLEQARDFLALEGVDIIMLDNMCPADMAEAVKLRREKKVKVFFEASGGITVENAPAVAATGVDFISIGALTHSARAVDYSLDLAPLE